MAGEPMSEEQTRNSKGETITERDRKLAATCESCAACARARKKQGGFFYWVVRLVEGGLCPACRAYEKVHGRKAHEPLPDDQ